MPKPGVGDEPEKGKARKAIGEITIRTFVALVAKLLVSRSPSLCLPAGEGLRLYADMEALGGFMSYPTIDELLLFGSSLGQLVCWPPGLVPAIPATRQ